MMILTLRNFCLFILLIYLFTSCTYFYTRIDSRVVENIEVYERLAVQIPKVEKEGGRRRFGAKGQLDHKYFKTLFTEYEIYEDIYFLNQYNLLHSYLFRSSESIVFGTKSYYDGARTEYAHQLQYKANNELPIDKNKNTSKCFKLVKSERVKENWFYVIVSRCDG